VKVKNTVGNKIQRMPGTGSLTETSSARIGTDADKNTRQQTCDAAATERDRQTLRLSGHNATKKHR